MASHSQSEPAADAPGLAQSAADARALRRRGMTLALLTIVYFFSFMDRYILTILLEDIKKALDLSDTQLGLLQGFAFAMLYATLGIPVARLADRSNRRNIIAASLALWSAMTAACGLALNYGQLLAARVGVGIGEAGSSPPSHSMIADLYPPEKRSGAMAIYSTGVVLGGGFGTMIGGTIAHLFGWRYALMAVGAPGLMLALIVWLFVVEPRRGLSDPARAVPAPQPPLIEGFRSLFANPVAAHLVMALTVTSFVGYSLASFLPSFMQRSYGVSLLTVALELAPAVAIVGTFSGIVSGRIADRLARERGLYMQPWLIAVTKGIAFPCALVFYLASDFTIGFTFALLVYLFSSSYLGPSFALLQGQAPVKMRALWAAITLLIINLIGLGLGPSMVGALSDAFRATQGQESLRYAMLVAECFTPWAIFHYWRAGVLMKRQQVAGVAAG